MTSPSPIPHDELSDAFPGSVARQWPTAFAAYGWVKWPRVGMNDLEARLGKPLADLRAENDARRGGPSDPAPYAEFGMPSSKNPCPPKTFYECFKPRKR
jgi:hypothetical protein